MPPGEDPDTLVQRGGAAAPRSILRDAVDVLERKLQLLEPKGWFGDMHRAREALDRLLPTLRAPSDPVTKELYITRVAERLGIPRETIATEVASTVRAPVVTSPRPVERPVAPRRTENGTVRSPVAEIERKLLRLFLLRPQWLARAREEVKADRFTLPAFRRIYEALLALPPDAPVGDALVHLDERARDAWSRVLEVTFPTEGFDVDREYAGALEALEEIHTFPSIAGERDPRRSRERRNALSKEGQARYTWYLRTQSRSPVGRDDSPLEE